jgi:predicted lysophospholipase L1 biosynthesis ABC-type transport system permease subunit
MDVPIQGFQHAFWFNHRRRAPGRPPGRPRGRRGGRFPAAVAAGLADRKRPFSLLRLTGARLGLLRRVVTLESAVPLLAVAVISIGVGFGAAAMYASVMLQRPLVAPGAGYYLIAGAGIAVSLGVIGATFPLLRRITGPEVARNE